MMQNNLMRVEDNFQEEDEINIYDLINIFIKNIKMFFIVTILGILITCLYIGVRIIFFKNNTSYINYTLNYEEINSYIGNNIYYPKKNPEGILLDNKYLEFYPIILHYFPLYLLIMNTLFKFKFYIGLGS